MAAPTSARGLLASLFAAADALGQITTVSVYLPAYRGSDWEHLRGSIVGSDASATAYTVFCADEAPSCQIAGGIPFVFTEGPATLQFSGSVAGEITVDLHCNLEGRTAATCTGSSSLGVGFREGSIEGPTQTVWTSAFSESKVAWGVLTLATPAMVAGTTNIEGTVAVTGSQPTASAAHRPTRRWVAVSGCLVVMMLTRGFLCS